MRISRYNYQRKRPLRFPATLGIRLTPESKRAFMRIPGGSDLLRNAIDALITTPDPSAELDRVVRDLERAVRVSNAIVASGAWGKKAKRTRLARMAAGEAPEDEVDVIARTHDYRERLAQKAVKLLDQELRLKDVREKDRKLQTRERRT